MSLQAASGGRATGTPTQWRPASQPKAPWVGASPLTVPGAGLAGRRPQRIRSRLPGPSGGTTASSRPGPARGEKAAAQPGAPPVILAPHSLAAERPARCFHVGKVRASALALGLVQRTARAGWGGARGAVTGSLS